LAHSASGFPVSVKVDGLADIFGAGHSSADSGGELPRVIKVSPGQILAFSASGEVTCQVGVPISQYNGPDGACWLNSSTNITPFEGISGIVDDQTTMFLAGVFLSAAEPKDPAPAALNFSPQALGQNFLELAPGLRQVFFIGDGVANTGAGASGAVQWFAVPAGATRLFLGFTDFCGSGGAPGCYTDNGGYLTVDLNEATGGNTVLVTLNATGSYGVTPDLNGLSPIDPRIGYDPAAEAAHVTGVLTCTTTATASSFASGNPYPVSNCGGLSDPGHTILYDYANSSYSVALAPVTLAYTGPMSIKQKSNVTVSVRMTNKVTGGPIAGRAIRIHIGRGHLTQHCSTGKTDAAGVGRCVLKHVWAYESPNPLTMWFAGDKPGPTYDYAHAYGRTRVTMVQ